MATPSSSFSLLDVASRGLKIRRRGVAAHLVIFGGEDGSVESLVGILDVSTCGQMADLAKHLRANRIRVVSPVRIRSTSGSTCDVVVATDLTTGRQAVVRLSDGKHVKCGRVRHEGVLLLMEALKAVREKEGGRMPSGDGKAAAPPKGRGSFSRSAKETKSEQTQKQPKST